MDKKELLELLNNLLLIKRQIIEMERKLQKELEKKEIKCPT